MSSIDKQSVRQQFAEIQANYRKQLAAGKVPSETVALFDTLILLFNVVLSIFLEKKTKKNAKNSSLPPSQTEKDATVSSKSHTKNASSKPAGKRLGNTRTVESTVCAQVMHCTCCRENLSSVPCTTVERRTRIDIIFEKKVEHVEAEVKTCPACHTIVKAAFPKDMPGSIQYGTGIQAYVIELLVSQMISLHRAVDMLSALIDCVLSQATLLGYVARLHHALEPWETRTKEYLLNTKCLNTDETSLRVDKKNHWIHVYSAGDTTLKCLHKKRGREAIEDIGLIPKYKGTIVHDCWSSYLTYTHCQHGLCGSHLLRELTFVVEAHNHRWARNMKRCLKRACRMVSQSEVSALDTSMYSKLQGMYRKILNAAEKELPPIPNRPDGRRGKIAKPKVHNLWERLKKYEDFVLQCAKYSHVPFTNNRAERDLRMSKVKQKVSGCFRSETYAHAYCRISSYLQTMKNKGMNSLAAISLALSGNIPPN